MICCAMLLRFIQRFRGDCMQISNFYVVTVTATFFSDVNAYLKKQSLLYLRSRNQRNKMAKKFKQVQINYDLAAKNYRHKIDGSYTRDCKSYLTHSSLRASSPIWTSEASLARTRFTRPNRRACSQAKITEKINTRQIVYVRKHVLTEPCWWRHLSVYCLLGARQRHRSSTP